MKKLTIIIIAAMIPTIAKSDITFSSVACPSSPVGIAICLGGLAAFVWLNQCGNGEIDRPQIDKAKHDLESRKGLIEEETRQAAIQILNNAQRCTSKDGFWESYDKIPNKKIVYTREELDSYFDFILSL